LDNNSLLGSIFNEQVESSWKKYVRYIRLTVFGSTPSPSVSPRTAMSKPSPALVLVLGALFLAGCAGDDTVNPLPPPDASTPDASKDATAHDGATGHDAAKGEAGATADASAKDATTDASVADAGLPDSGAVGSDALADALPDSD
jgi:hypothetical protein